VSAIPELELLTGAIHAVARFIERAGGRGMITGGVAVCLLARARYTEVIDALLIDDPRNAPHLLTIAAQCGLSPRIDRAAEFALESRELLLKHDESETPVDLALGSIVFEQEAVERSVPQVLEGFSLRLPTREDLIIMKAVAGRPEDFQDIVDLAQTATSLDVGRIETWVRALSEMLDAPERWSQVASLLTQ
jgi:hypothetical protein